MTRKSTIAVEELNSTLDKRFAELTVKLTETLTKHFDETFKKILEDHSTQIQDLTARVDGHSQKINELTTRVSNAENTINQKNEVITHLQQELDDQINRNMRNNLVIRGIPEAPEGEREDTRSIVCAELAKLWNNDTFHNPYYKFNDDDELLAPHEQIEKLIDRAHRGGKRNTRGPRNIYVKFLSSQTVDQFMISIRSTKVPYRIERQYSKAVNERRNTAMIERKRLKDANEIQAGYLEYPAKLMVKAVGENKYKFFKDF